MKKLIAAALLLATSATLTAAPRLNDELREKQHRHDKMLHEKQKRYDQALNRLEDNYRGDDPRGHNEMLDKKKRPLL